MKKLLDIAKQDISTFLERNTKLFFNERDFQMHLATYLLGSGKYDEVFVEYYVPKSELPKTELEGYVWGSELYLDIVVRKGDEYLPIELKYKTKSVEKEILRFGESIKGIEVLKNQSAQNLGKYNFWKDVRRLELVRNRFSNIRNGIAVFFTNDKYYLKASAENSGVSPFNMNEGVHDKKKSWKSDLSCAKGHPNFVVEEEYEINWEEKNVASIPFYYCILSI